MKEVNPLQDAFFTALASIQENCVQTALCQPGDWILKERLYDVTAEVLVRVMELLDGYADAGIGTLQIVSKKTGQNLKEEPFLELHDAVCSYLKGPGG